MSKDESTPARMLYESPGVEGDEIEDVPVDLDEEDFDFGEFVAGILPTRKRVRIYPNGHLLERVEALLDRIEASDDDLERESLTAECQRLSATMRQSVSIIVEARSSERLSQIEREAYADGVPNASKIGRQIAKAKLSDGHPRRQQLEEEATRGVGEVLLRQIADQIVHPTHGVDVDALRALRSKAEPELERIYRACREANSESVGSVSPDFSQGRSGARPSG